jgi:hypothetical protein
MSSGWVSTGLVWEVGISGNGTGVLGLGGGWLSEVGKKSKTRGVVECEGSVGGLLLRSSER